MDMCCGVHVLPPHGWVPQVFLGRDPAQSTDAPGPTPFFPWLRRQGCMKVAQRRHLPCPLHMCCETWAPQLQDRGGGRLLAQHPVRRDRRPWHTSGVIYSSLQPSAACSVTQGKTDSDLPKIRRPHLQPSSPGMQSK